MLDDAISLPSSARAAVDRLFRLLQVENDFEIAAFDELQARAALSAFERFGKGIHPKARLNLADCAVYALAATMRAPLLFKGDDFSGTDVELCALGKRSCPRQQNAGAWNHVTEPSSGVGIPFGIC